MELQTPTPPFFFRVDMLRPDQSMEQRSDGDRWLPPRPSGSNQIYLRGEWLRYSGQPGQNIQPSNLTPPSSPHHDQSANTMLYSKSYSMYYSHGTIWVLPYDASERQVSTGTQDGSTPPNSSVDLSNDEDGAQDWESLMFNNTKPWIEGISYVSEDGHYEQLIEQWPGQQGWLDRLLPDRYRTSPSVKHNRPRQGARRGGLCGELPVLIGLLALSVTPSTPQELTRTLRGCMQARGWREHGEAGSWVNRRGVIVHVRNDVNDPASTSQELDRFANGGYGNIFP
ncbi:hypothetical protein BAUCODRAFT_218767 [Baudoinia panamericana UAMH 10762]|uniref:Uncharacterized protein n=1 Tax=Baudoinia panamericana (strain UAMH 10762) TaxID=717646 RepID=M2LIP2_BAUPA|nr:uncharacterized protein BAUCODRAFT_218767 [Baudoinia panamericana UAMH 10762]EMC94037.1 hypothetical protein BAUCODRAFT_218767 [Baudoinia panamericana UAMH 10762]